MPVEVNCWFFYGCGVYKVVCVAKIGQAVVHGYSAVGGDEVGDVCVSYKERVCYIVSVFEYQCVTFLRVAYW